MNTKKQQVVKMAALALVMALVVALMQVSAFASGQTVGDFDVQGGTLGVDYRLENDQLILMSSTPLIISGTSQTQSISVQTLVTVNVTLDNVNIDVSALANRGAIIVEEGAQANITLKNTNTLKSGSNKAGVDLQTAGVAFMASSTGSLDVYGGYDSAGIGGGGYEGKGGIIAIHGGVVRAYNGENGAAIGTGSFGNLCTITITGGSVTATSGYPSGAGIGGGLNGSFCPTVISGGTVTAIGGSQANGIGGGENSVSGQFTTKKANGSAGDAIIKTTKIGYTANQNDWSGIIFIGDNGKLYGSQTLAGNAVIESAKTLEIPAGTTLSIPQGLTLTNQGKIINLGAISGSERIVGTGLLDCRNHAMTTNSAVAPTCTTQGVVAHFHCENCNLNFEDAAGITAVSDLKTPATGHLWDSVWTGDNTHHWHQCKNFACPTVQNSDKSGFSAHNFVWVIDKPASANASGLKHLQCELCGGVYSQNTVIDKSAPNTLDTSNVGAWILWLGASAGIMWLLCVKKATKKSTNA